MSSYFEKPKSERILEAKADIWSNKIYCGQVYFSQFIKSPNTNVYVKLENIYPPGEHGFHVHESGDMSQGCESMGPHYNPTNSNHGSRQSHIRHTGDFGNIYSDMNGSVSDAFSIELNLRDILNRGLVIHENRDDYGLGHTKDSLTTGNSGKRIACGVIEQI